MREREKNDTNQWLVRVFFWKKLLIMKNELDENVCMCLRARWEQVSQTSNNQLTNQPTTIYKSSHSHINSCKNKNGTTITTANNVKKNTQFDTWLHKNTIETFHNYYFTYSVHTQRASLRGREKEEKQNNRITHIQSDGCDKVVCEQLVIVVAVAVFLVTFSVSSVRKNSSRNSCMLGGMVYDCVCLRVCISA